MPNSSAANNPGDDLPSQPAFRQVLWGYTPMQVEAAEGRTLERNGSVLSMPGNVAGFDARIEFIFVGERLARARYVFLQKHGNDNTFFNDYDKLKHLLIKKYGTPESDKQLWHDELFRQDRDAWHSALGRGDLRLLAVWSSTHTIVRLALQGDNFDIDLTINYISRDLQQAEALEHERRALEQL